MRLIDADSLIDKLAREPMNTRTYLRANELVLEEPTVNAIPLDKAKQAREDIQEKAFTEEIFDEDIFNSTNTESVSTETAKCESYIETEVVKLSDVLDVLDKLIGESEGK